MTTTAPAKPTSDLFYGLSSSSWGSEEIEALHRVIQSDRFTMGENVKAFENALN